MKTYIFSSFSFIRLLRIKTSSFFFNRDYCAETMFLNFWRSFTGIPVYFAVDSYYFKPSIFFKAFYVYVSYFSLFLPLLFGKYREPLMMHHSLQEFVPYFCFAPLHSFFLVESSIFLTLVGLWVYPSLQIKIYQIYLLLIHPHLF